MSDHQNMQIMAVLVMEKSFAEEGVKVAFLLAKSESQAVEETFGDDKAN
ncbi:MAG: hypothetical protein ACFFDT_17955 [Candidatus Hodarchaeota archaeon]